MQFDALRRMSVYNRWANGRLYDACAGLAAGEYHAARPAFFGSIHGTLNHILVADRVWLARIRGGSQPELALDDELFPDLESLRAAREEEDAGIVACLEGFSETDLAGDLSYRNASGEPFRTPLGTVFQHLFNHQTHHRGQVHDMLSQTAVAPPPLDLIYFVRTAGPS